jgi:hypothetical protein
MAHGAEFEELLSRITADAERLARAGKGPSELVDAVVRDGATGLAALAAERHHHAVMTRLDDERRALLAERSPVFRFDPRTLIAAPVGRLEREGLARFADRVLSAAADSRPARVVLVLQGFEPHEGADDQIAALAEELSSLGASLERQ